MLSLDRIHFFTYDFEGMSHYSDCHQLLAVVSAIHHERVGQSLDDWTLCLSESFCSISACGVGDVDGLSDLNVVTKEWQVSILLRGTRSVPHT